MEIWYYLVLSPWLGVFSLQSCHIGEEDEGGEQEGEEPSFEVRQTEMVWGDQGKGHRGVSGEATPHAVTTPGHHTRHTPPHPHTLLQHFFFYLSLSFLTSSLKPVVYFLLWWTDLCMPLLAQQSDQCYGLFLFYLLPCMTWVQRDGAAKDNKMKPRFKTNLWVFASCIISES